MKYDSELVARKTAVIHARENMFIIDIIISVIF